MRRNKIKRAAALALSLLLCVQPVMAEPLSAGTAESPNVESMSVENTDAENMNVENTDAENATPEDSSTDVSDPETTAEEEPVQVEDKTEISGDEGQDDIIYGDPDTFQPLTSANQRKLFRLLSADGLIKSGNYEKWIERVNLPNCMLEIYKLLSQESFWTNDAYFSDNPPAPVLRKEFRYTNGSEVYVNCLKIPKEETGGVYSDVTTYIMALYSALDRDFPGYFWSTWKLQLMRSGEENSCDVYIYLKEDYGKNVSNADPFDLRRAEYQNSTAISSGIENRNNRVNEIASQATGSDYEKVKKFNEWLTHNNAYNEYVAKGEKESAPRDAWECISALEGRTGNDGPVCEGYARAFKLLCEKEGIPCVLVDGNAVNNSGTGAHMWNYVQLGENWYGVDVTWNDPYVQNAEGTSGHEREDYLCVGSMTVNESNGNRTFIESHPVANQLYDDGPSFINGPILSEKAVNPDDLKKRATITNETYPIEYTYKGTSIEPPVEGNFKTNGGIISYEWYQNGIKLADGNPPKDAGTYTLHVNVTGNETYAANYLDVTVTIKKAELTDELLTQILNYTAPTNLTYNGQPKDAAITLKSPVDGLGNISVKYKKQGEVTYLTSAPTDAGSYEVWAQIESGKNYNAKDFSVGSFTIAKATANLRVETNITKTYGNDLFQIEPKSDSTGAITYSNKCNFCDRNRPCYHSKCGLGNDYSISGTGCESC